MPLTATVARGAAALGWKASREPARSASARIDLAIVDLSTRMAGLSSMGHLERLLTFSLQISTVTLLFSCYITRVRRKRIGKGCPVVFERAKRRA